MTNITLVKKWRGEYHGGKLVFPTSWHRQMYQRDVRGTLPKPRRVTKSLNYNFASKG